MAAEARVSTDPTHAQASDEIKPRQAAPARHRHVWQVWEISRLLSALPLMLALRIGSLFWAAMLETMSSYLSMLSLIMLSLYAIRTIIAMLYHTLSMNSKLCFCKNNKRMISLLYHTRSTNSGRIFVCSVCERERASETRESAQVEV
jgi:hypothetical protein